MTIPNWNNNLHNKRYQEILKDKLTLLKRLHADIVTDRTSMQAEVDNLFMALNDVMHTASKEAGCVPNHQYKPKAYWCPELSASGGRYRTSHNKKL